MGWYIELHCDTASCPHGAAEQGPQGRSTKIVAAIARKAGWRQIGFRWFCDRCVNDSIVLAKLIGGGG